MHTMGTFPVVCFLLKNHNIVCDINYLSYFCIANDINRKEYEKDL